MFKGTTLVKNTSPDEINRGLLDLLDKINNKKNTIDTVTQAIVETIYPLKTVYLTTEEHKENKISLWPETVWEKMGTIAVGDKTITAWIRTDDKT